MSNEKPEVFGKLILAPGGGEYKISGGASQAWVQLPSEHQIYAKIGRIAATWSSIEHLFDVVIWRLANIDPKNGACITAQVTGLHNRLETLKALLTAQGYSKKTLGKLETFKNNTANVQERRNRIVHDPWLEEVQSKETAQFKSMPRKELTFGVNPVAMSFVDETLKSILERRNEAIKLVNFIQDDKKP